MKILESMPKNNIQFTVRGASNLKGFNLSPIQDPKIWKISVKKVFHCAREAFMSMLIAHEALMSICAHESFMSMLMKLSRARAREGVTRTTTIGQYASSIH